jgi:hypothetical protein
MIIMDPTAGIMEVCPLPALSRGGFTTYTLTVQDAVAAAAE